MVGADPNIGPGSHDFVSTSRQTLGIPYDESVDSDLLVLELTI
jgi:hypothetical protein